MSNILQACFDTMNAENKPAAPKETDIIRVCEILKQYLFDFVIAGGYPRDVYYGVTPKDCDICIYNFTAEDIAESHLYGLMLSQLQAEFHVAQTFGKYEEGDERIGMVIKLPDQKIDIIFYEEADSPQQVLRQFDCNLSQFLIPSSVPAWEHAAGPQSLDLSAVRHLDMQELTGLKFLAEGLTSQRICYMADKFEKLTGLPVTGTAAFMRTEARQSIDDSFDF